MRFFMLFLSVGCLLLRLPLAAGAATPAPTVSGAASPQTLFAGGGQITVQVNTTNTSTAYAYALDGLGNTVVSAQLRAGSGSFSAGSFSGALNIPANNDTATRTLYVHAIAVGVSNTDSYLGPVTQYSPNDGPFITNAQVSATSVSWQGGPVTVSADITDAYGAAYTQDVRALAVSSFGGGFYSPLTLQSGTHHFTGTVNLPGDSGTRGLNTWTLSIYAVSKNLTVTAGIVTQVSAAAPTITGLSPDSVVRGGGDTTVTITGTNFYPQSTVTCKDVDSFDPYGGQRVGPDPAIQYQYVSPTRMTATLPASALQGLHDYLLSVDNTAALQPSPVYPDLSSGAVFYVKYPVPTVLDHISPTLVPAGAQFTLTLYGSGFEPNTGRTQTSYPDGSFVYGSDGTALEYITTDNMGGGYEPKETFINSSQIKFSGVGFGLQDIYLISTQTAYLPPSDQLFSVNGVPTQDILYAPRLTVGPPMAVTAPRVSGVTPTAATVSWTTNYAADSVVYYGTSPGYGGTASAPGTGTGHSVPLTGLSPGILYYYQIVSTDVIDTDSPGDVAVATTIGSFVTPNAGTPSLSASLASVSRDSSNNVVVTLRLSNGGTGDAAGVQITSAALTGAGLLTPLPAAAGAVPAGGSAAVTLTFAARAPGRALLTLGGGYAGGGGFSTALKVTVP